MSTRDREAKTVADHARRPWPIGSLRPARLGLGALVTTPATTPRDEPASLWPGWRPPWASYHSARRRQEKKLNETLRLAAQLSDLSGQLKEI
jgi:hypothetical protein